MFGSWIAVREGSRCAIYRYLLVIFVTLEHNRSLSLSATDMLEGSVSTGGLDILVNRNNGIAGDTEYHEETQCATCVVNLGPWYDSDHANNHLDTSNSPASLSARTLLFCLEKVDNSRTVCVAIR